MSEAIMVSVDDIMQLVQSREITKAKEIAEEIDPEKINLDNPAELLKNLMSGNLENDTSGLMNLVSNITSKMHDKISSGDIDENKLFNDAKKVMSNFNNSNLGGNNMFSNLFSQMSNNFNTPAASTPTSTPISTTTSTPDDVNKIMSNLNNPNLGENSMFSNLFSQMSNNFNNPTSMPAPQANNRIKLQNIIYTVWCNRFYNISNVYIFMLFVF